ncbi:MAG TPA: SDR family NAD(P)-dependent oxidoreductase, partial [Blastocatellia bacterium]|nr:SDR family NAD(P)-dependent oxidoreductase [Blastocatellia bacterium]
MSDGIDAKAALKMAYDELARRRAEIEALKREATEAIAIVGMACKFPGGADTPDSFWKLLEDGVDAITEIPRDRWDADAFYNSDPSVAGKMATRYGGFLKDGDLFDYEFFAISPKVAQLMDPQQRLLLEVAWEALENANIAVDHIRGASAGVFVGITCFDQALVLGKSVENSNSHAGTSTALNMAAGRLSYALGVCGPSMAIDTACSSSLVAIHLACQSLRQRESDLAIAGGVNYILSPEVMVSFSQARMLASDGRCKTFDDSADGYSRGEGCGVVVLKRLSDAVAGGDEILGIIRGSAVNQDGASGGLTVPNGAAQEAVIRKALERAAVAPDAVAYVEAHGTGTPLGDPIEIESLAKVYGRGRTRSNPVMVASVKTNIGHLEPASGVAGLIKVLLSFKNQKIPPHLHFNRPNLHIPWEEIPIAVPAEVTPWPVSERRRIAGISSFGFSGTNAHLIVEEPPARRPPPPTRRPQILTLSAKTEEALLELAERYLRFFDERPGLDIAAVCQSSNTGRSNFNHRLALVTSSIDDARSQLNEFLSGKPSASLFKGDFKPNRRASIAFVFGGGLVSDNIVSELYKSQKAFHQALDLCNEIIERQPKPPEPNDSARPFAVNFALAEMWKSWGVQPNAVGGRDRIGTLLSECVAGVITIEEAIRLALNHSSPKQSAIEPGAKRAAKLRLLEGADETREKDFDARIEIGTRTATDLNRGTVLRALADLYVRGTPIDWLGFEGGNPPLRVTLPNYPFRRRRCRLDDDRPAFLAKHLYTIEWEEQPLQAELSGEGDPLSKSLQADDTWLILGDRGGCGAALEELLRKNGQRVMIAFAGEMYAQPSQSVRLLNPVEASDFKRLLDDFFQMASGPTARIINLWSLDATPNEQLEEGSLNQAQRVGPVAMLLLVRALRAHQEETTRIWVVTRGATSTGLQAERVAVAQAPLWGFGKVVGLEHPELFGAAIDLDSAASATEVTMLTREVFNEGSETHVAFRDGRRYVPRIVRAALPPVKRVLVSPGATYVITGGLGVLGLKVASWLVSEGARHLALLGRGGPRSAAAEESIKDLELKGARVIVVKADVAEGEQLYDAFRQVSESMPPVRGVIHAAGVAGYTDLDKLDQSEIEDVLRPKVSGAWQLHRLTKEMELDFFICFSSIASAWGSRGQAHYAAANSFLDGLAQYRRALGLCALSVNWGPWAGGGMSSVKAQTLLRRVGVKPISAEDAVEALALLPQTGWAGAIVADVEWDLFSDSYEVKGRRPLLERLRGEQAPAVGNVQTDFLKQLKNLPPGGRTRFLTEFVQRQAAQVLGLESSIMPHTETGLFEMGMDSLMALEFRSRLETGIAHSLPATLIFDHPTIKAVVDFLLRDVLSLDEFVRDQSGQETRSGGEELLWAREPVAIIGIGCRFPSAADSPEAFWRLLRDGVDAITEVPPHRWKIDDYYDPDPDKPGKMYSRHGGFIQDADKFDASFFRISPREAASMDPQQRLALEVSWEALENAGQASDKLKGTRTGVFIGITTNDYALLIRSRADTDPLDGYFFTGNPLNTTAGRISYALGLQGPSMAIDTACSSSLVSVHQACQSLRSHESDLAIAGGVNLILAPENTIAVCRTRALSPGGRCKTFDESADGFTRSEGCGIVILKLLSSAIADKDRVLAVIRGSAVNQDGASSGFTVPNGNAQQAVIRQALGGINPLDVDYVEAHGTGTALGDPVEVLSLAAVFGKERPQTKPLLVGSVKTNIGHAESAAGIASLIKVVLGLNKEEIPPSLHFKKPNPHVPWGELPISVCESLRPWPRTRKPRIAGVSAFGASGTNAHLIVEEAPEIESAPPPTERPFHVLTLSAKSDAALRDLAARYKDYLVSDPRESISDICFTANTGRSHFRHRLALVCSSAEDAGRKLADFLEDKSTAFIHHSGADAAADYSELPPELNRLAARLPKAGNVLALGSFSQEQNDWRETLNNLARLYCMGT